MDGQALVIAWRAVKQHYRDEDAVQEAVVRVLRRPPYGPEVNLPRYLAQQTRFALLDAMFPHRERREGKVTRIVEAFDPADFPTCDLVTPERIVVARDLLRKISERAPELIEGETSKFRRSRLRRWALNDFRGKPFSKQKPKRQPKAFQPWESN